jgi:kynureninase
MTFEEQGTQDASASLAEHVLPAQSRPTESLARYREHFPILARTNYLISNSLGAVPAAVATSLQTYFDAWAIRGVRAWEDSWWTLVSDVGDLLAPLIGARNGEVIFQPNVTLTHAVVFSALCFTGRRNKIVTDGMHFPSILYLIDQQRKFSAKVDVVPSHDGITIDTDELLDHIDETTAIVNVSHVLFKSAYIHDVAAIADKARRVGAMTLIDGYQAVGTIPVDVRALGVDAYIGGCLKWLCGGPGNAFLWVDPAMRRRLAPAVTGWMAHQRPFSFEPELHRRDDAWRLLNGTPSIPALHAAIPGLKIIDEVGIDAIRETSQRHTKRLLELADREGYPCTTPRDPSRRGGTVAINIENAYEISQGLKALDILCDYRPGAGIRFSPHFYNLDSEIDAAIEAIREIRSSGAWRAFAAAQSKVT